MPYQELENLLIHRLALFGVLLVGLGCSSSNSLEGRYVAEVKVPGREHLMEVAVYEFSRDGKVRISAGIGPLQTGVIATYQREGDTITISGEGKTQTLVVASDGKLDDGNPMTTISRREAGEGSSGGDSAAASGVASEATALSPAEQVRNARVVMENLRNALDMFQLDVGRYPTEEEGLDALRQRPPTVERWGGPYLRDDLPSDPWGSPFEYRSRTGAYTILSFGEDGRAGGSGPAADLEISG